MEMSHIIDQFPKAAMVMVKSLFDEGKCISDFKVVGNSFGYSLTFHITDVPSVLPDWSRGRHRSPSSTQYSQNRRQNWIESCSPPQKDSSQDIHSGTESNRDACGLEQLGVSEKTPECKQLHIVNDDSLSDASQLIDNDNGENKIVITTLSNGDKNGCPNDNLLINDDVVYVESEQIVEKSTFTPDEQYKNNILDDQRNRKYNKIVHDTRNDESRVYGQCDDLIVSVDEKKKRYTSWAIHDRYESTQCQAIYDQLKKWPAANTDKCKYGVETLIMLLPDIVKRGRVNPDGQSKTVNY